MVAGSSPARLTIDFSTIVVMRIVTKEFESPKRAGWNHTPLELFTSRGRAPASAVKAWFCLFDNNTGFKISLGKNLSQRFSTPDAVNREISKMTDLGRVGQAIQMRYAKRKTAQAGVLRIL